MNDSHSDPAAPSSNTYPHDDHYDNEHTARRSRLALPPMRSIAPVRYHGDGLDYRRPVVSSVTSAAAPVIDLTTDSDTLHEERRDTGAEAAPAMAGSSRAGRLPRFGGRSDIIDLADDVARGTRAEERQQSFRSWPGQAAARREGADGLPLPRPQFSQLRRPSRHHQPTYAAGMDDDLEIISEVTLSRPPTPSVPAPRSVTPFVGERSHAPIVDLTEDDDLILVSARHREGGGGINAAAPGTAGLGTQSAAPFGIGRIASMLPHGSRLLGFLNRRNGEPHENRFSHSVSPDRLLGDPHDRHAPRPLRRRASPHAAFRAPNMNMMPGMMDYNGTGFDLGYAGAVRPASPYNAPAPLPEGFTRNPKDDEVVVCPNCGDELAVSEDEVKQQVWVVKACGHAYCGRCATHRRRKISKKAGKAKVTEDPEGVGLPPPFSGCVVVGCASGKKSIGTAGMIHVYLGS
ncbi:hypothetical protein LTR53_013221 [Teratosphaeriaceae sp. CCFEE 6253]|nr:hypothetical protein LTR53_013221 [Teratosphaeriaceae sp. CCFEE 6253]